MTQEEILARQLLGKVFELQKAVHESTARKAEKYGLTIAQSSVVEDLITHPDSSLNEVCVRVGLPKSSVSRLVDDLVQAGFVKREIPADNRRTVLLSIADDKKEDCQSDVL